MQKHRFTQDAAYALGRFSDAMLAKHGPEDAMRKIKEEHGDPFSLSLPQLESLASARHESAVIAAALAGRRFSGAHGLEEDIYPVLADGFTAESIAQRGRLASEALLSLPSLKIESGMFNDPYDARTAMGELKEALLDVPDRKLRRLYARIALRTRPSSVQSPMASSAPHPLVAHCLPVAYFQPLHIPHDYRRLELGDRWVRAGVRAAAATLAAAAAGAVAYALIDALK